MSAAPFEIDIPDSVLDDLRDRLSRTRWPEDLANDDWGYGTNTAYLKSLCEYWADQFDWRAIESRINEFPQFKTEIQGTPIHFIHVRGKGPNPKPLILSHGWPWTFWDFQKVIAPLTDPVAHGGKAEDAFDVVIPSLPGFGFSTPLKSTGINYWRTADLWVDLMASLGYEKFYAEGGDWGGLISTQLGHKYADRVLGVYLHFMLPLDIIIGPDPDPSFYSDQPEIAAKNQKFFSSGSGYSAIQFTVPQTLANGLNDSPAGLCSWILEKRRAWSHCNGDIETVFSKDDLCTTMTLYWATQSFCTSARYYADHIRNPWTPSHENSPVVAAPTGVAFVQHEVANMPRKWAEHYYNLQHWTEFSNGGHFLPMEAPDEMVKDMRRFFGSL